MTKSSELRYQVAAAIAACEDKKADNIAILQMDKSSSAFTDYFVIGSGANPRQVQAIADEVELRLKSEGIYPNNIEGYQRAEWVLLDYVDFVVHVFSEAARKFYDLERLWKAAKRLTIDDLKGKISRARTSPVPATPKRRKTAKSAKSKTVASIRESVRSATSRAKPKVSGAKKSKPLSGRKSAKKTRRKGK